MCEVTILLNSNLKEISNYIVFGILTTLVNVLSFYLLDNVIEINYLWANAIAIFISILFAYHTNRKYVFSSSSKNYNNILTEFFKFLSSRLVTGLLDMLLMFFLIDYLAIENIKAKIIIQILIIVTNFIVSKYFVFN